MSYNQTMRAWTETLSNKGSTEKKNFILVSGKYSLVGKI